MCYTSSHNVKNQIVHIALKEDSVLSEKIYDRIVAYILENQDKLYRLAYCYTNNKDSALDIVQNAIVKALENYDSLRNPNAIKTWMYRIVVNEALTFLKKQNREIACEPTEFLDEVYYEPSYEPGLSLYMEINKLPREMQTVIMLHFFEELTLKEVSMITGVNLNTVKSRLYAALAKLKIMIKEVS